MTDRLRALRATALAAAVALLACAPLPPAWAQAPAGPGGDFIVAVVGQELVTAFELAQRIERTREAAQRAGERLPPGDELRRQLLDALIDERVMLGYARENGMRADDADVDRAVANVAAQNQLTVAQLRDRLAADGTDYGRFRANIREQMMIERLREREVLQRVRVDDAEVDAYLAEQRRAAAAAAEVNIAQILVPVPEGADAAQVAERQAAAERALARVRGGEPFADVAREVSQDPNRERGGELGMRPAERLPDLFVDAVRDLPTGAVAPALVRSGAGFHVLKVVARQDAQAFTVTQTRVRHILVRPVAGAGPEAAAARLDRLRTQIASGQRRFEDVAREVSEDGSAAQGGDLGWVSPGAFVPEFEQAMDQLPVGGLSPPVRTRFGTHLIQVQERRTASVDARQLRQQAREVLRERKFADAYVEWVRDLRSRTYIELRDAPL